MTVFIAHAEGVDEFGSKDELSNLHKKRYGDPWLRVTLPSGESHDYFEVEGEEPVQARIHATGALLIGGGRVYGPSGWAFADGAVVSGPSTMETISGMVRRSKRDQ